MQNEDYQVLSISPDYEGEVVATLISAKENRNGRPAILYIHGFIDYFFHDHFLKKALDEGFDFYALELRKYGRSMLPHQHPNYCRDLQEYFEEITLAIRHIKEQGASHVILYGHSTGGLIAPLYAALGEDRESIDCLVLNSPFLALNIPAAMRVLALPLVKLLGKISPFGGFKKAVSPMYTQSIHADYYGEWKFDTRYKPIDGFPAYFQWLTAISRGQSTVQRGLNLKLPVLLLHSSDSYIAQKIEERVFRSDIVLNVRHMKKYGPLLGNNVSLVEVQDGIHDLLLSKPKVREEAMQVIFDWLNKTTF